MGTAHSGICRNCQQLFQHSLAISGTNRLCPRCQATDSRFPGVEAGSPLVERPPTPIAGSGKPVELLSLDDAEPTPSRSRWLTPGKLLITLLILVVVTPMTTAVLGYQRGRIPPWAWQSLTTADGECRLELPGEPTEISVPPTPGAAMTRGGKGLITTGWYSGVKAWIEWQDLDPDWVKQIEHDRDGLLVAPLFEAERDRYQREASATTVREVAIRFGSSVGREVQMETSHGQLVARWFRIVDQGQARLYCCGVAGRSLVTSGPAALGSIPQRLFTSLRFFPHSTGRASPN